MSRVETRTRYNIFFFGFYSFALLVAGISPHNRNTFRSIPHLIEKWYPTLGRFLGLLCTQKWFSASKIAGMPPSLPILMLSGPRNTVISSEMVELWEISRMRGSKKNTESFWSAFRQNDEEESLISPEKDAFEIFDQESHGAYHFSELPFS